MNSNRQHFFSVNAIWIWAFVSILTIGIIDFSLGYEFSSFLFYFLPVGIIGWKLGLLPSILASTVSAVAWIAVDSLSGHPYTHAVAPAWNVFIRFFAFLFVGWTMAKISGKLRKSDAEIKILESLLPICAQCKKIRDENGCWHHMEAYIEKHSNLKFTHGYCSECGNKLLAEAGLSDRIPESQYQDVKKESYRA